MFDIGFTEILVIATISLLVIGPERLPETVRAVTMWIGRFKRSLRDTRREIEQHIGADDIRRELHNEEVMKNLEKIRTEVSSTLEEGVDLEEGLYPPGHHDHDPNNDPDGESEPASQSSNGADQASTSGKSDGPSSKRPAGPEPATTRKNQ